MGCKYAIGVAVVAVTVLSLAPYALAQRLLGPGPLSLEVGKKPRDLVVADVDGDGAFDLAVANRQSQSVSVLLGDGLGSFSPAPGSPYLVGPTPRMLTDGSLPVGIATGDFDTDGNLDLAVLIYSLSYSEARVRILRGDGMGRFENEANGVFVGGSAPWSILAAELTGDGVIDLAVTDQSDGLVRIVAGDGSGGFFSVPALSVGGRPVYTAAADLSGDGRNELAVVRSGNGSVTLLRRDDTSGGYVPYQTISVGNGPVALAIADLDNDDVVDIAVVNRDDDTVTLLEGVGNGTFTTSRQDLPAGASPEGIAVADLDDDGESDLIIANRGAGSISVFRGAGSFRYTAAGEIAAGQAPRGLVLVDFDGDARPDLVFPDENANTVRLLTNDGQGSFVGARIVEVSEVASVHFGTTGCAVPAHLGDDPEADLVIGGPGVQGFPICDVEVFRGDGEGAFTGFGDGERGKLCQAVNGSVADFDGDGRTDLLDWDVDPAGHDRVKVLFTGPAGLVQDQDSVVFELDQAVCGSRRWTQCVLGGDFDGDGTVDLLVSGSGDRSDGVIHHCLEVLLGRGGRSGYNPTGWVKSFPSPGNYGWRRWGTVVADFNGDGADDFMESTNSEKGFYLADRVGGFDNYMNWPSNEPNHAATAGDVDGDGDVDLIFFAGGEGVADAPVTKAGVVLMLGDGQGNFSPGESLLNDEFVLSAAVGDLNDDDFPDIVAALGSGPVFLYPGDESGAFTRRLLVTSRKSPTSLDTGDLDGDGLPDLTVAAAHARRVEVLFNQLRHRADVNGSNRIDGFDVNTIGRLCGKTSGELGYRSNADVNLDGIVDGTDLAHVADRFGELDTIASPLRPEVIEVQDMAAHTVTLQAAAALPGAGRVGVDMVVNETQGVAGASFCVTFDPAVLRYVGFDPGAYLLASTGQQAINVKETPPGRLVIVATILPGNAAEVVGTGPERLAELIFEARSEDQTRLEFEGVDGELPRLVNRAGNVVPGVRFEGAAVTVDSSAGSSSDGLLRVTPPTIVFGEAKVGTTKPAKLKLANVGGAPLTVHAVDVLGERSPFASFFTAAFSLDPLGFVELTVTFRPAAAIEYSGTLHIESDGGAVQVQLRGSGRI